MRIYYFGELIKDTNKETEKVEILEQTTLELNQARQQQNKKVGMDSIGDLLKELDLNLDSFRVNHLQSTGV